MAVASGAALDEVVLTLGSEGQAKAGGCESQKVTLKAVFVSGGSTAAARGGETSETYSLVYRSIRIDFSGQDPKVAPFCFEVPTGKVGC